MQEALLDILVCPDCRVALNLAFATERDGAGRIVTGVLECSACSISYPITRGIPRLLPKSLRDITHSHTDEQQTSTHFTQEFTALAHADKDLSPAEVLE